MSDELTLLKAQADTLGVPYSNNIGVESLKKRIAEKMNPTIPDQDPSKPDPNEDPSDPTNPPGDDDTASAAAARIPKNETKQQMTQRIRQELIKNETRLIRCRIACLNPAKNDLKGELITVGNKFIGAIRKFVPFGDAGESYHLPKILVDDLRARMFNQVKTRRGDKDGQVIVEQRMIKEYSIEELPPLTKEELADLARQQAAAAGQ